ncbi:hypothetical protein COLO4_24777 [Corchorus olitorius]|uniref:Uncharacterized protein n=1 Tax=Corchorus olitorius TaxID=93759 RepID=A0A1R3I6X6_9ROSI|nr:hypothetical protein COLO4_24777 [Corchorus olitorius]
MTQKQLFSSPLFPGCCVLRSLLFLRSRLLGASNAEDPFYPGRSPWCVGGGVSVVSCAKIGVASKSVAESMVALVVNGGAVRRSGSDISHALSVRGGGGNLGRSGESLVRPGQSLGLPLGQGEDDLSSYIPGIGSDTIRLGEAKTRDPERVIFRADKGIAECVKLLEEKEVAAMVTTKDEPKWIALEEGWMKFIVDGAYDISNQCAGIGIVARNSEGKLIVGVDCQKIVQNLFMAEALALKEGLKLGADDT